MNKYKVSIIIPCYNINSISNDCNSFDKTVTSVFNQSFGFENIELILVDDCSTDNSYETLKKYSEKFSNIKIYQTEKNKGRPGIPRNIGINNATSDYIIFLDSDDTLNKQTVEILYSEALKNDVDIVKMRYNIVIDGIINKKLADRTDNFLVSTSEENLKYGSLFVWNGIYRKKFLDENNIRYENFKLSEDTLFMINCYKNTTKIYIVNKYAGVNYNNDNLNSISHNCFNLENLKDHLDSTNIIFNILLKENFNNKYVMETTSNLKQSSMIYLFYSNDDKKDKIEMFNLLHSFLVKYDNIPFVKSIELSFSHYLFWKMINRLIILNFKHSILLIMDLIKLLRNVNRH